MCSLQQSSMECKLKQRESNTLLFDKLKLQEFKKLQRIAIKRILIKYQYNFGNVAAYGK